MNQNYKIGAFLDRDGVITELPAYQEAEEINEEIIKKLEKENAFVDATYYCPHHPTKGINEYKIDCDCRKPKPGLIKKAIAKYDLDVKKSYMVGDRISDIKAGKLAGCKTIGVKTGYACNDGFKDAIPDVLVENLFEAAKIIVEQK